MKRLLFILLLCSFVVGCVTTQPQSVDTTNLYQLEGLTVENAPTTSASAIGNIRLEAIEETATSLGAQGGLAARAMQINALLEQNANKLDLVFNFQALLLNHNVLPPVLVESNQLLNLADPDTIRLADKTYKIVSQARFVTTAPNWRQYLLMDYQKPAVPDNTLLPRNVQEQRVWIQDINKGWQQGTMQAKTIYLANLARLERDYNGMILYRKLLAQNIISKPYVAQTDLGVTSNDDNSQLYINDQVLRITALPELNPNSKQWRAVLTND